MSFGLQTFTIRKAQKKSLERAYLPFIKMGITEFEIARIDFTRKNAERIKAIFEKHGAKAVSVQVKPKYVFGSPEKIIDFCKIIGCKNVVISMLPFSSILGREKIFYSFVDSLDATCDIYAKEGITLAYHHHNWEYIRLSNGKTRMGELIERTKKLKFVHDTYWSARSAVPPEKQLREFGERLLGVHLRDLTFKKKNIKVIARDAAVGDGVIDFSEVLSEISKLGCEYMVIEQKTDTPYADVKRSFEHLCRINQGVNI